MFLLNDFYEALTFRPSPFRSIQQVNCGMVNCAIYAVVREYSSETSVLSVEDPTGSLSVFIVGCVSIGPRHFIQGNIVRIIRLHHDRLKKSFTCRFDGTKVIPSFSIDYESNQGNFESEHEKKICHQLEKWESEKLLSWNLSCLRLSDRFFVNFVCQVLRQRAMTQAVVLDVWDGHRPSIKTKDRYCKDFSYPSLNGLKVRRSKRLKVLRRLSCQDFIAHISIWTQPDILDHYKKIIECLPDENGSYLVIYNMEVMGKPPVTLTLRSRLDKGTCIHIVHPHSVLGRIMSVHLEDKFRNSLPESVIAIETRENVWEYEC